MNLYLAHGFAGRHAVRRLQAAVEINCPEIKLINPFYSIERPEMTEIDAGTRARYDIDPDRIVKRDLTLIDRCDGILGIIDDNTRYGTPMELWYAADKGMPVYLLVINGEQDHPWLRYIATSIVTSSEELYALLRAL